MPRGNEVLKKPVPSRVARALIALPLCLAVATACSEKGRSLVRMSVDASPAVGTLARVKVVASQAGREVGNKTFPWTSGVNELGLYVDKGVSGQVSVAITGRDIANTKIAEASGGAQMVAVEPGSITTMTLLFHLVPVGPDPGTDGGAGASGATGGAGGGNGSGGAAGGSAGAAATGGAAGATATGGAAGAAAGGSGGSAGGASGPTWKGAKMVEADVLFDDWTTAVAVDASGNAVLVYRHGPGIRASRFTAATATWAAPVVLESRTGQAYSPAIGVDKNGQWLVIWQQAEGMSLQGIWQSTSADGVTWTAPTAITTAAAFEPELSMNRDGFAAAAWYGRATDGSFVTTASIRAAGAWGAPTVLKAANTANGYPLQKVAVSGTSEAFVVWEDPDDGPAKESSIWLRRYSAGAWTPAALVETFDDGS
ncbi:MAG: hypothetical protein ABUL77_02715, partial [Bacteroidota bacterium]